MARKPLITDKERIEIAKAYNQNPHETAKKIRLIASQVCGRDLGLSTVQRELAKLKKSNPKGSTDPIDNQWSLASLRDYPVDPNAIQFLLYIQATFEANLPDEVIKHLREEGESLPFLTIRLALWISRLLPLIHFSRMVEVKKSDNDKTGTTSMASNKKPNQWDERVDRLVYAAMWYSNFEIGCELAHIKPINTINFDAPTLNGIISNIDQYHDFILAKHGIKTGMEPNAIELLKSIDVDDIVSGGRHARTHRKKK